MMLTSRALSYCLMILVIISLPVVCTLHIPRKVMAQAPSEGAKVLVDDVIQSLKANDISRAQIHLNILNQQLPTFVNSPSLQSIKVLLDDVTSALKNNDVNNALVHLNLVKQQLTPNGSTTAASPQVKETTSSAATSQITNVKANHPPKAYDLSINTMSGTPVTLRLTGDDPDGDPITFSIVGQPSQGKTENLNVTSGEVTYDPTERCVVCTDVFDFKITDSHNAVSNNGTVTVIVSSPSEEQSSRTDLSSRSSVSSTPSGEPSPSQPTIGGGPRCAGGGRCLPGESPSQPSRGGDNAAMPPPGVTNENPPSTDRL